MPIAMPWAPKAKAPRRGRGRRRNRRRRPPAPSPHRPPAAAAPSSARCRCGRRPSPPWMVTTLAPISIAFWACLSAPTVGMQTMPASRSRPITFFVRPAAVADGTDAVLDRQVEKLLRIGLEHVEVQPERLVARQRLHTQDLGLDAVGGDRGASQEPEAAGVGRRGDQVRAGHPAHRRLHDGVAAAEQVAKRRAQGHLGGQVFFSASPPAACDLLPATMLRILPPSVPAPSSWLCVWRSGGSRRRCPSSCAGPAGPRRG